MTLASFLRTVSLLTGLVIVGEAAALIVGMRFLSPQPNPWLTSRNTLLLATDLLFGSVMLYSSAAQGQSAPSALFLEAAMAALAFHGYREWESLINLPDRFCLNTPLFAVNTVKTLCLLVLCALGAWLKLV